MNESTTGSVREKLILAGIAEIENHGIQNASIRRVATACGVSCAAPYKHFRDKNELLRAIIDYIYSQWGERRESLARENEGSTRRQLVAISVGFIRFLHENPHFRSVIMLRDTEPLSGGGQILLRLTEGSRDLIERYCREVNMPPEVQRRKTFVVRSLIYGAALMLDSRDLTEDDLEMAERMIDREFDLE